MPVVGCGPLCPIRHWQMVDRVFGLSLPAAAVNMIVVYRWQRIVALRTHGGFATGSDLTSGSGSATGAHLTQLLYRETNRTSLHDDPAQFLNWLRFSIAQRNERKSGQRFEIC